MITSKEKEILDLIVEGYTNKEIAKKLVISEHTVKAHKESIYSKLNVHNKVQAVIKYLQIEHGLNMLENIITKIQ